VANKISVILDFATDKAVSGIKGFRKSIDEADGAIGKVKAGAGSAFDSIKANAGLAGVAVVGAVGAMAAKSIEAASRLGESVNAVNVTFGESAEGIKALGEQAAESVGLSNAEFNGLAVQFSAFADTIAGKGGDVVGTIDDMTHRAADFASVMNIDVAEAARLFQSGLAGETEPLKKFGIDLSAAAVKAFALSEGIIKAGDEMTEAQKVQARYGLLMQKTAKTQDDFANTSDGLANSQRILAAKMEDTAAKVGKDLAPALAAVTTVLSDLIPVAGTVAVGIGKAFETIVDSAYALGSDIADVWYALPFTDAPELIGPTLYEWRKLEQGTADLVAEFAKGKPTMEEFIAAMVKGGVSQEAQNLAVIQYRKQLDGLVDDTGAVVDVTDELTEAVDRTADGEELADKMIERVNATYERQTETAEAAADALKELTENMIDQVDSAFTLESSILTLDSAYAAYQESVMTTTDTLKSSEATDREKEQALRDLREQEIGVAGDALATAEAYAQEMGAADGSAESAQFQKDKLQELAAAMPELRDEIQKYIDKLNAVPGVIRTRFEITATGATVTPHGDLIGVRPGSGGSNVVGASGGIVTRPTLAWIGERGPEAVVPLSATPGSSPLGMGGGINLTVNAGMGADGHEISHIIVKSLGDFVRLNGPGPLRTLTGG
jgi:uncharacterized phage infection (PIP) family protein YhgE